MKVIKCNHCGNVVLVIEDAGVPMICCGEKMGALEANTQDAAVEKHIPVYEFSNNKLEVSVGSVLHPMSEAHSIRLIAVANGDKIHSVKLGYNDEPKASFIVDDTKPITIYEYCNLHGLWKIDVE